MIQNKKMIMGVSVLLALAPQASGSDFWTNARSLAESTSAKVDECATRVDAYAAGALNDPQGTFYTKGAAKEVIRFVEQSGIAENYAHKLFNGVEKVQDGANHLLGYNAVQRPEAQERGSIFGRLARFGLSLCSQEVQGSVNQCAAKFSSDCEAVAHWRIFNNALARHAGVATSFVVKTGLEAVPGYVVLKMVDSQSVAIKQEVARAIAGNLIFGTANGLCSLGGRSLPESLQGPAKYAIGLGLRTKYPERFGQ